MSLDAAKELAQAWERQQIINSNTASILDNTTGINPWVGPQVFHEKHAYQNDTLGKFTVRRIENGFILEFGRYDGDRKVSVYAETPQALADAIVAKLVESRLEDR